MLSYVQSKIVDEILNKCANLEDEEFDEMLESIIIKYKVKYIGNE